MRNSELVVELAKQCSDMVLDEPNIVQCTSETCYCKVDDDRIRAVIELYMLRLATDIK